MCLCLYGRLDPRRFRIPISSPIRRSDFLAGTSCPTQNYATDVVDAVVATAGAAVAVAVLAVDAAAVVAAVVAGRLGAAHYFRELGCSPRRAPGFEISR